ncbi:uncharacterized protein PHACADRAFT_193962 [Phanerochaete carnosa HHB-10118-sp]|uniref:Uncharacterized protein n=1 Tax=Phanerochaete carnosa (strain HHB-10118-sp) TaxID=650164 RepID=K5WBK6_PHACS|nr:uncharacterized protein PHACADRAFT_193962 [Phanerochaete carnosa HHB-10118-sp]EKM56344.1 hypothetical protein PHACADRAFT_193962 [Phanerochaete carnosa HHB-10118-sp]
MAKETNHEDEQVDYVYDVRKEYLEADLRQVYTTKNSQDDYSTSNWGTTTTDTTKDIGDVVFNNSAPTDTTHTKEQYEYHKDSSSANQHKKNSSEKGTGLKKKPGLEKNKPNK